MGGIRICGDVHGKYADYVKIVGCANELGLNTVQVGDMGFYYDHLNKIDAKKNKFLGGNHDNYHILRNQPPNHYLGDWGMHSFEENMITSDSPSFFFFRGAFSIDKIYRMEGRDWWPDEELSILQGKNALGYYLFVRPNFVVTHDCPVSIVENMYGKSRVIQNRTGQVLQSMYDAWQPDLWIFGHHHVKFDQTIGLTRFICLPELGIADVKKNLTTGRLDVIL